MVHFSSPEALADTVLARYAGSDREAFDAVYPFDYGRNLFRDAVENDKADPNGAGVPQIRQRVYRAVLAETYLVLTLYYFSFMVQ